MREGTKERGPRVPEAVTAIAHGLSYFAASVRRHRLFVLAMAGLVVLLAGTTAAVLPQRFKAEVELTSPRAAPGEEGLEKPDDPAQSALEIVYSDATLLSIAREAGLTDAFFKSRPPLLRWKDSLVARLRGPPSRADVEDALVKMLASRIGSEQGDETIVLSASWTDAKTALQLADAVAGAFLAARHQAEVTSMSEAIAILQKHADEERAVIAQLQRLARPAGQPAPLASLGAAVGGAGAAVLDTAVFDPQTRLALEGRKYASLLDRLEEARIAMDRANAAFGHRYGLVKPAELPRGPDAPAFWPIVFAALLGGFLLGALAATALDATSGVAFHPWQIERALRLRVVGEVRAP
ncbi:MAG TPA: hypothetical protein VGH20_21085 [Myxococcales bacterium]|jgi:uncharacterized protein involved in exopolysaccharide biosynthesis